jgi:hypothetical protein
MFPWEHLAFGYLLYSGLVRLATGGPPRDAAVLWLAVGTQFPDLVDKPLAWSFDVLTSGVLVHAIPVAVPAVVVLLVVARATGRTRVAAGFAVGWLSHIAADVLYPLMLGNSPAFGVFLWPFVTRPAGIDRTFTENLVRYLGRYLDHLTAAEAATFLAAELALLGGALVVWHWDGRPGAAPVRRLVAWGQPQ